MRITMFKVNKIKVGYTEDLNEGRSVEEENRSFVRSIYFQTDKGEVEIALFNDNADKLKVFNVFEDKSL